MLELGEIRQIFLIPILSDMAGPGNLKWNRENVRGKTRCCLQDPDIRQSPSIRRTWSITSQLQENMYIIEQ